MSIGTLYTIDQQNKGKLVGISLFRPSTCCSLSLCDQIKAVAALAGLTYDSPTGYTHFETNKTPEFLAKFPHGKIPAFEGKDGFKLFETTAIARYCEHF